MGVNSATEGVSERRNKGKACIVTKNVFKIIQGTVCAARTVSVLIIGFSLMNYTLDE